MYVPGEESIWLVIPALKGIIASTAKQWDEWDDSPNGNTWKTLNSLTAKFVLAGEKLVSTYLIST